MRKRGTAVLGVACGVVCAACVLAFMMDVEGRAQAERAEALARYGGEQLEVCVAKRDIAPGEVVDAAAVETKLWVADLLPADAVRSSDEVVGRRASSAILQGEVFSLKRFQKAEQTLEVPEGLAAVSVPARDVQAVGGALRPGMKVDVYSTGQTSTKRILSGVLVVSTNGASASDASEAADLAWVTLAVDPGSVQEVVAAAQTTDLYFTLPGEAVQAESAKEATEAETGGDAGASADEGAAEKDGEDAASSASKADASASAAARGEGRAEAGDEGASGGDDEESAGGTR